MSPAATVAQLAWLAASIGARRDFARALRDPRAAQEELLQRTLGLARSTRFGHEHEFGALRDLESYAARVPARDYDEMRPWLAAVRRGERGVLTPDKVLRMQPTGGSTGGCKWIPYTSGLQAQFGRAIGAWISDLAREHPAIVHGRAYWSITPAGDTAPAFGREVAAGFEDDSAYLGGLLAPLVSATLAVPPAIARVRDMGEFRRLTLLHLLRAGDLRMVSVWHPSFFELLLDHLAEQWPRLLADLARGLRTGMPGLDLPPSPRRAHALRSASPERPASVWPHLALVSCWGDAAAAAPMEHLRERCPGVAFQPKGLIATEAIVTIPCRGVHALAVTSHVFEFERGDGSVVPAWELEPGETGSVIVTTAGGLYRYRLRDRVQVTGLLERTPCLRLLGKEDRVSDRCGEKLDEAFVAAALERVFSASHLQPEFAMLAPESDEIPGRYVLYLASRGPLPARLAEDVENALCGNPQYAYAVRLGQLTPASVETVGRDAARRYLERLRSEGARLGDIKPAALSRLAGWRAVFAGHPASS